MGVIGRKRKNRMEVVEGGRREEEESLLLPMVVDGSRLRQMGAEEEEEEEDGLRGRRRRREPPLKDLLLTFVTKEEEEEEEEARSRKRGQGRTIKERRRRKKGQSEYYRCQQRPGGIVAARRKACMTMTMTMMMTMMVLDFATSASGVDMFNLDQSFLAREDVIVVADDDDDDSVSGSSFNATSSFISHGPGGPPSSSSSSSSSSLMSSSSSSSSSSGHGRLTPSELRRLFRSAGCHSDEIVLRCASDPGDTIVVEEASFYALPPSALNCSHGPVGPIPASSSSSPADTLRDTFFPQLLGLPRMSRDLRQALNRRCSGLGSGLDCQFNLALDHPESSDWGSGSGIVSGLIDVFYRCVPRHAANRQCARSPVTVRAPPEGDSHFLLSPVYPKYLVGGRRCRWTLRAEPGQRIQLRLLDVSLRERGDTGSSSSSSSSCEDSVSVSERGKPLLRMCGELKEDVMLLSEANTIDVRETHTVCNVPTDKQTLKSFICAAHSPSPH